MYKEAITDSAVIATAMASLRQIFVHDEYLDEPFHPAIKRKLLIYPYNFYFADHSTLKMALAALAKKDGDEGYYFRYYINNPDPDSEFDGLWYIPFQAPGPEPLRIAPLENVCFSPHGTWALMATYDAYGLLGGTEAFMDELLQMLPDLAAQVVDFVKPFPTDPGIDLSATLDSIKRILIHIYGSKRTREIFQESAIPYPDDPL